MKQIDTNKAWDRMMYRLEKDDLLTISPARKKKLYFPWVAAIVLLCFGSVLIHQFLNRTNITLLSIQNTNQRSTMVTTLKDGSTIFLGQNTRLDYPDTFAANQRKVHLEGDALFDISKDVDRPFIIETANASVEVLGTSFKLHSLNDKKTFVLTVREGKVKISQKGNSSPIYAIAGESVRLDNNKMYKNTISDNKAFEYYTENMWFKDQNLGDLLNIIGKVTGYSFILADPQLGSQKLTVAFENNSPRSMTELICLAMNLSYVEKQDTFYISKNSMDTK